MSKYRLLLISPYFLMIIYFLVSLFSSPPLQAHKPHRTFFYLPQAHFHPILKQPGHEAEIELVAKSQWKIFQYLWDLTAKESASHHLLVFAEGIFERIVNPKQLGIQDSTTTIIRNLFSNVDAKTDLDSLSDEQKFYVVRYGAKNILMILGKILAFERTEDREIYEKAATQARIEDIFSNRHKSVRKNILTLLQETSSDHEQTIVLIFGAYHDFNPEFTQEPRLNFTTPLEFHSDSSGEKLTTFRQEEKTI